MQPFDYSTASASGAPFPAGATYLAGGTTLLDLMKLGVVQPERVVNIGPLRAGHGSISLSDGALHLGGLVRMADAAASADVQRECPAIGQSLLLAASPQLRNMATLAGNVLQRTRCAYFRDITWPDCNKRNPGSGCAALGGVNRRMAVLGTSEHCIATYPGDFATVLAAFGASVTVQGAGGGSHAMPFEDLHRPPGTTPDIETNLQPGDLITGFAVPLGPWTRRSLYLKIRDRESYDFAQASAAIGLTTRDGVVAEIRVGVGGVAAKPWRAHEAEQALHGRPLTEATAQEAAEAAFASAVTHGENDFKPELGRRTLVRALLSVADMEG